MTLIFKKYIRFKSFNCKMYLNKPIFVVKGLPTFLKILRTNFLKLI